MKIIRETQKYDPFFYAIYFVPGTDVSVGPKSMVRFHRFGVIFVNRERSLNYTTHLRKDTAVGPIGSGSYVFLLTFQKAAAEDLVDKLIKCNGQNGRFVELVLMYYVDVCENRSYTWQKKPP